MGRFEFWILLVSVMVMAALEAPKHSKAGYSVRWLSRSDAYKAAVLAQPAPVPGQLKHIEWDGWGFLGQDTTVFLAFDPADALAPADGIERPGKLSGLPCPVFQVRRLESHWYTVRFYTNSYWYQDECE
jgi:hypothetical protein